MERLALELVDSGIITVSSRGQVSLPSPGLAIAEVGQLEVGRDAASRARLKPRRLHSRYWQDLGTENLGRPFPGHLRMADLAHAHLSQIWEATGRTAQEVVVAVPGLWSGEQLGLLLGIAQSCAMPVRGLVDVAVAATADRKTRKRCLHLDMHLHRAVLTVLEHGAEVVRQTVVEDSRLGLVQLYDLWARTIAKHFVRTTRFDPLHQAATEQILYIQLHNHLATLSNRRSAEVAISSGGRRYSIELDRRELVDAAQQPYDILRGLVRQHSTDEDTTLLLGDHAADLPGIGDFLSEDTGIELVALHSSAAGSAALDWAESICTNGPSLPLVTRLPGYEAKKPAPMTIAVNPETGKAAHAAVPTHLVIDGVARRISSTPLFLSAAVGQKTEPSQDPHVRIEHGRAIIEAPSSAAVLINDEKIDGAAELVIGDRLRYGSHEILLVSMAD